MLLFIHDFESKSISLRSLVDALEGSLHVLEEKLPQEFYSKWYEYWGDLETVNALQSENMTAHDPKPSLESLKVLISNYVDSNN